MSVDPFASLNLDVSVLDERSIPCINDLGSKVTVFADRLEIQFSDEANPRVFHLDTIALYKKIVRCQLVCYDDCNRKRLKFELEHLSTRRDHTIRIEILKSPNDNFRVEVLRSRLLSCLAYYHLG